MVGRAACSRLRLISFQAYQELTAILQLPMPQHVVSWLAIHRQQPPILSWQVAGPDQSIVRLGVQSRQNHKQAWAGNHRQETELPLFENLSSASRVLTDLRKLD